MLKGVEIKELLKSKKVTGAEIVLGAAGEMLCNTLSLTLVKEKLDTGDKETGLTSIEALEEHLDKELPLCLCVRGKGIINKKIEIAESDTEQDILNRILPNAEAGEFYQQKYPLNEREAFVVIVRKKLIDDLLSGMKDLGFHVVEIFLGPVVLQSILPLIGTENSQLQLGADIFHLEGHRITEITATSDPEMSNVFLGGEMISGELLYAFSVAFNYFFPQTLARENNIAASGIQQEEYFQKRLFKVGGITALSICFLILLVNFLVFTNFRKTHEELYSSVTQHEDQLLTIQQLQQNITYKKKLLDDMGLLESSATSFHADRIAGTVPRNVRLSEMFIHPLKKKRRKSKDDELEFIDKVVSISGTVEKSTVLNDWIKDLKDFDWISRVVVVNFTQDNRNSSGEFELEIALK